MEKHRGHDLELVDGIWIFVDKSPEISDICGFCGGKNTKEGHDACIGTLPDVMNACCGHGDTRCAYVQFWDGSRVAGCDAIKYISSAKQRLESK